MKFKPFQVYEPESRYKDDCLVVMQEFDNDYFYKDQIEKFVSKDILMKIMYKCTNPGSPDYINFHGKGIKICPEWMDMKTGRNNFHQWFINEPNFNFMNLYYLDIGRRDINGDFTPDNCYLYYDITRSV